MVGPPIPVSSLGFGFSPGLENIIKNKDVIIFVQMVNGMVNGGINMGDRKIENSFNQANIKGTNVQGDNVQLDYNEGIPTELFQQLMQDIGKIKDEEKKELAKHFAEEIQKAASERNFDKAKKGLKWLSGILTTTASLASIATFLGIVL